jgi:hypothetical protein
VRQCCTCKANLDLSLFGKNKSTKDLKDAMCKQCRKDRNIINKKNNALIRKRHYESNKEKILLKLKLDKNPNKVERISEYNKKYRVQNLEKIEQNRKEREKAFPYKKLALNSKRRATKIQATPAWLSKSHLDEIKEIYKMAKIKEKTYNQKYHVDHIVPLLGESVCGLHVPWNLQVLEARANIIKGNNFEPI